jgi:[ribosomal protein S18]-alanine N-acetyltransferase
VNICRIRQATYNDIDAIMQIEDDSFDPAIRESRETFQERLEVFPEGFVLLENGNRRAVGYLSSELWNLAGNPIPSDFALGHSARERHAQKGKTLYISSYGILAPLRGRGLGKLFFRNFLEYARDLFPCEKILLLVSETWTGARTIYTACGFDYILTVPGFFRFSDGDAADGLVMQRSHGTLLRN